MGVSPFVDRIFLIHFREAVNAINIKKLDLGEKNY